MAATYLANPQAIAPASAKNLFVFSNHTGSGKIAKIHTISVQSVYTSAQTGAFQYFEMYRCASVASFTGGSAVTAVKMDSTSGNVPAQLLINTGTTTNMSSGAELIRRFCLCTDELTGIAGVGIEDLTYMIYPLSILWDAGKYDTTIQPLTLREGEGFYLYNPTGSYTTFTFDLTVEFTLE